MAEPKTKPTKESVEDFLNKVEPEQKSQDSFALLEVFKNIAGEKPSCPRAFGYVANCGMQKIGNIAYIN